MMGRVAFQHIKIRTPATRTVIQTENVPPSPINNSLPSQSEQGCLVDIYLDRPFYHILRLNIYQPITSTLCYLWRGSIILYYFIAR